MIVWVTGRTEEKRSLATRLGAHEVFEPGARLPPASTASSRLCERRPGRTPCERSAQAVSLCAPERRRARTPMRTCSGCSSCRSAWRVRRWAPGASWSICWPSSSPAGSSRGSAWCWLDGAEGFRAMLSGETSARSCQPYRRGLCGVAPADPFDRADDDTRFAAPQRPARTGHHRRAGQGSVDRAG